MTSSSSSSEPGALILLSGGLDSAVTAAVARSRGFALHGLTFSYGQRHEIETERARELAGLLGFHRHDVIPLARFPEGSSSLTDPALEVPRHREGEEIAAGGIPSTYVPARNTIFLAHALGWSEALGLEAIFLGVNALDYSGYPDCRPEYLEAFQTLARLATRVGVETGKGIAIEAPLVSLSKAEIIRRGAEHGVDFSRTWSCYAPASSPGGGAWLACGACDSCLLRARGFQEAGIPDPTPYLEEPPRT